MTYNDNSPTQQTEKCQNCKHWAEGYLGDGYICTATHSLYSMAETGAEYCCDDYETNKDY